MATTIKTFVVEANHGKTHSDAPFSDMLSFIGTDKSDRVTVSQSSLNGDRALVIITKTT